MAYGTFLTTLQKLMITYLFLAICALSSAIRSAQKMPCALQIRDLDTGTIGFVQLALDLTTGEQVAIKFIERSQEVS